VGFISVEWRNLTPPLESTSEAFIDFIGVHEDYRRQGIASQLIK